MHFELTNEWARFQQAMGRRVYVISSSALAPFTQGQGIAENEGIAVERKIFWSCRYLEVNGWTLPAGEVRQIADVLHEAGKQAQAVFVRWTPPREIPNSKFSPPRRDPAAAGQILNLKEVKLMMPQILVHQVPPKATRVVDLSKDEGGLVRGMHEKTRYNIRLAERKGVVVNKVNIQEGLEKFWALMQETSKRDTIGIHPKEYYRKMLETMQGDDVQAYLFLATHEGAPLATAILMICGDTAIYLHGGSSNEYRNLMAPHLLQWRMMQFAKAQGCQWYDFWGISAKITNHKPSPPRRDPAAAGQITNLSDDPWAGITRFKVGFGGEVHEGAGTFDIVCRPAIYRLLSWGRQMKDVIR